MSLTFLDITAIAMVQALFTGIIVAVMTDKINLMYRKLRRPLDMLWEHKR